MITTVWVRKTEFSFFPSIAFAVFSVAVSVEVGKRWTFDLLIKICFLGFLCGASGLPNPVVGGMKSVAWINGTATATGNGSSGGRAIGEDG